MQARDTRRDPFPGNRSDDYFFTTPALRLRLDLVHEHIRCGETPVLILGESGAGKSTMPTDVTCTEVAPFTVCRQAARTVIFPTITR